MPVRALEILREAIDKADAEGCLRPLWAIVSAMRGPDDYNQTAKELFTTPLRHRVLTREQAIALGLSQYFEYPRQRPDDPPAGMSFGNTAGHFLQHIQYAYEAFSLRAEPVYNPDILA